VWPWWETEEELTRPSTPLQGLGFSHVSIQPRIAVQPMGLDTEVVIPKACAREAWQGVRYCRRNQSPGLWSLRLQEVGLQEEGVQESRAAGDLGLQGASPFVLWAACAEQQSPILRIVCSRLAA
jgi:hypothetical protein